MQSFEFFSPGKSEEDVREENEEAEEADKLSEEALAQKIKELPADRSESVYLSLLYGFQLCVGLLQVFFLTMVCD